MTLRQPNFLEKLGSLVPGYRGYADRETRRTADQRLRARVGVILDEAKADLNTVINQLTAANRLGDINAVETLRKRVGSCADSIRNVQHGGSGLMDSTVVKAGDLDKVYQHDLGLHEQANAVAAAVRAVNVDAVDETAKAAQKAADAMQRAITARDAILEEVFQCPS